MHSSYDSVKEQTGLFAGKGGFDVTVGEHTQLNGAVIGSTASADNNRLDTGTQGLLTPVSSVFARYHHGHANQTLSPVFDKEKEQKRLQAAQLISEIGNQAADIARTQGEIAGLKAKKDLAALLSKAIAGGAAPYLAEIIHKKTTDPITGEVNTEANLMAHAVPSHHPAHYSQPHSSRPAHLPPHPPGCCLSDHPPTLPPACSAR